jgi:hypothetical protein
MMMENQFREQEFFLDIHGFPTSTWLEDYTNSNGDIDFEIYSSCEVSFSVDCTEYQTKYVDDGDSVIITV